MASTSVVFDILANDRASSKFDHLSSSVDHSGGALNKFANLAGKAAKVGALALGAGAVVAAKGLYEMAQGAAEDQAAASKLAETLKNSAHATDDQVAAVERWISAQGVALGVADDDLRPALQRLAEATGSVTEAQDLASVAMDASAATGKSLKTISEALLRAHNGSVGGLSRYGIATKNAKGETLSFDEVVKGMAETFEGQASKHADTLAGKMDRLKLQVSEAGEAIGYKLLPYAADAADWLGDHLPGALDTLDKKAGPVFEAIVDGAGDLKDAATPLVSELAEALGHLTDEGGGAGDMFHDKLLPAFKTGADLAADLVNFIDNLPGPVKTTGIEVGIAAIAFGKLNGALGNVVPTMGSATGVMGKFTAVTKQAAGIGGLLALTHGFADAKSQGDKFMGVLEGFAGGAALGFAAGGPVGALIGAAGGGGLMGLVAAFSDTEREARDARRELMKSQGFADAKADADALTEALQGVVNEYGNVAIATVKNALRDPETGNLVKDAQVLSDLGVDLDTVAAAILGQKDALDIVRDALGGYGDDLDEKLTAAKDRLNDLLQAQNDYAQRGTNGIPADMAAPDPSGEKMADYSKAVEDAQDALDDFNATQDVFNERTNQGSDAVRAHRQLVRELTDDLGIQAKVYNDWPTAVRTEIEASGLPQTSAGLLRLIGNYKGLQKFDRIKTLVSAPGAKLSADDVLKLQKRYDLTPEQVKTLLVLDGLPATVKGIAKAQAEHRKVDGKQVKTLLQLLGVDATLTDVQRVVNALRDLDSPANDVNNYIYTHHKNVGDGTGGGPNLYGDDGSGRFAPGRRTPTIPRPQGGVVKHVHEHRYPGGFRLRMEGGELRAYLEGIADDRIYQSHEFARMQED